MDAAGTGALWRRAGDLAWAIIALLIAIASPALAQRAVASAPSVTPYHIPSTEVRSISSTTNGIGYRLYVSLPPGYDTASARYPVVYMLDADYSFPVAHATAWHLAERSHLPPVILIAVAYDGPPAYRLNRTRDYTPVFDSVGGYGPSYQRVSGGAPRFIEFLKAELIPFVDANYRTTTDRTLVGHSYGGLFALWTSLQQPTLFRRILAVSPSLWYRNRYLFQLEKEQRDAGGALPARMYVAAGDLENPIMASDLRAWASQLRSRGDTRLRLHAEVLAGETHNSIFPGALGRGLRWLFDDLGAR